MKGQPMKTMFAITFSGLMLFAVASAVQADTIVFQDSFNNGVVANSDSVPNYWTPVSYLGAPGDGTITEANGPGGLTMTVARPASANNNQLHLETTTYSYLNFFDHKITIDCSLAVSITTANSPGSFRFTLGSQPLNNEYGVNDGIQFNVEAYPTFDKVTLQAKQNAPNSPYTALTTPVFPATLSRFVLTLDATTYSLSLYLGNGSLFNAVPYTGSLGLDPSQWGPSANPSQYNHDSAIDIEAIVTKNAADPGNLSANLTNLTVSVIPEPASLGLLALGGLLLLPRRA